MALYLNTNNNNNNNNRPGKWVKITNLFVKAPQIGLRYLAVGLKTKRNSTCLIDLMVRRIAFFQNWH